MYPPPDLNSLKSAGWSWTFSRRRKIPCERPGHCWLSPTGTCPRTGLGMTYYGQAVAGEWPTSQTYNGGAFIELIQPVFGQSMFHATSPSVPQAAHSTLHSVCRLAISTGSPAICANKVTRSVAKWTHPIARMAFFDTYQTLGVATEIMGIRRKDRHQPNAEGRV